MKYSKNFNETFNFLIKVRNIYNFDGGSGKIIYRKRTQLDKNDSIKVDGKRAFLIYESTGRIVNTKHPRLFETLCRTKTSINLHINTMYAPDRASGVLPLIDAYDTIYKPLNVPEWFIKDIESAKIKFYKGEDSDFSTFYAKQKLEEMKKIGFKKYLEDIFEINLEMSNIISTFV